MQNPSTPLKSVTLGPAQRAVTVPAFDRKRLKSFGKQEWEGPAQTGDHLSVQLECN